MRDYSEKVKPIAKPRGLPTDADPRTVAWRKQGGADLHSVSWLTLREVLKYDWTKPIPESGLVGPVEAARVFAGLEPRSWCQGRGGMQVEPAEMKRLLKKHPIPKKLLEAEHVGSFDDMKFDQTAHPLANHFTHLEWGSSPRCDDFLEWVKSLRHTGLGRNAFDYDKPELRADPSKADQARGVKLPGTDVRFVFAFDN